MTHPDTLAILLNTRTIAMIGVSDNIDRPSNGGSEIYKKVG